MAEKLCCPNCGAETEPIEAGVSSPPLQDLQLCPKCYVVTWIDKEGIHLRQGVPMNEENEAVLVAQLANTRDPEEC